MLLPLTVTALVGLVLGAYTPFLPVTILCVLLLLALVLACVEWRGTLNPGRGAMLYGSLVAGLLYALLVGPAPVPALPRSTDSPVDVTGIISRPVHHGPQRTVFVLDPEGLSLGARAIHAIRITWRFPDGDLVRGDRVAMRTRLHGPSGTMNPGGFDYAAHVRRAGIEAVGSLTGPGAVHVLSHDPTWRWQPWGVIDRWRDHIRRAAVATLADPALGVYLGMITGETGYLTPPVRDAFMATGTVHILSISGSHLGLVALLSFWLVKRACDRLPSRLLLALSRRITPTRLAALLTLGPVGFYTFLAGAEVATVRSFIMIALFLVTVWLEREQHLLHALAVAALLILMHDPAAVFEISFQLSFVSVLAIALVIRGRLTSQPSGETVPAAMTMRRWLADYLWMTIGITLMTTPLVAFHFNQVAWLGLLANAIVVPFAGLVLVPLGLLSAVATLIVGSSSLLAGHLNQGLFDLLCSMVSSVAQVPGAEWHVASPSFLTMAAYYLFLLLAWGHAHRRAAVLYAVGAACVLGWWLWSPRASDTNELRVTFLDVGQGDAAVIEMPRGQTVLIDGGAAYDTLDLGRTVVAPFLWDRGIRRLDHVIATHPQLDHVGGLATILDKFEVGQYWDNGVARQEAFYQSLDAVVTRRQIPRRIAAASQTITSGGGCRLLVLNPEPGRPSRQHPVALNSGTALNNLSIVTRLDCERLSVLFTADIESEGIRHLPEPIGWSPVTVLKVPHHGARSSLHLAWLHRLHPDVSIVSVGRYNPYGHPAPAVIQAYSAGATPLLRTDQQGAVWLTAGEGRSAFEYHRTRDLLLHPIDAGHWAWAREFQNLVRLITMWTHRM